MQRWASHFMTMLEHIVREPETSLQAISMLDCSGTEPDSFGL
ncbi:hypothetical protein QNN00_16355 [Bacillus velezensis]|nr:hypothetical protein [Bacillus velezensis]